MFIPAIDEFRKPAVGAKFVWGNENGGSFFGNSPMGILLSDRSECLLKQLFGQFHVLFDICLQMLRPCLPIVRRVADGAG